MTILVCFGTRPEYIKVKSLIEHLPDIQDFAVTPEQKIALTRIWIGQWSSPGYWLSRMSPVEAKPAGTVR